jgi:hypothetical protein
VWNIRRRKKREGRKEGRRRIEAPLSKFLGNGMKLCTAVWGDYTSALLLSFSTNSFLSHHLATIYAHSFLPACFLPSFRGNLRKTKHNTSSTTSMSTYTVAGDDDDDNEEEERAGGGGGSMIMIRREEMKEGRKGGRLLAIDCRPTDSDYHGYY